jgi:hypothetical protein
MVGDRAAAAAGRARGRWRDDRQVLEDIVFTFRTGVP